MINLQGRGGFGPIAEEYRAKSSDRKNRGKLPQFQLQKKLKQSNSDIIEVSM